jgi:hypothetical protein
LQARGWKIGFAPAALVWHHHRATVSAYWRQQVGYGEGEEWLLPHHPDRFENGHPVWRGHIYSSLPFVRALSKARVNTGPWGTAPFPSVYLGDAYPFAFMPHKARWLAASLTLLVTGAIAWIMDADVASLLLPAGALGITITIVRCLLFALQSDIATLPRIGRLPPPLSRLVYRSTIGLLHFLQPFARAFGRVRGKFADVEVPSAQLPAARVSPSWRQATEGLGLVLAGRTERRFWGETQTDASDLLSAIRDRLQSSRAIRAIDIDDGWQPSRDIGVQIGRRTWLDLRALVEDHGAGKRLARLGMHVRLTFLGVATFVALLATSIVGVVRVVNAPTEAGSYAVIALTLYLASRWTWRVASALASAHRCVTDAAAACGMQPVMPSGGANPANQAFS